jgi:AmmeMemoRadiSam system protein B
MPVNKNWLQKIIQLIFLVGLMFFPAAISARTSFSLACTNPSNYQFNHKPIDGVILPHHEVASMVWQPTFSQLAAQKINKIILLSPNHFWLGKQSVVVASEPAFESNLKVAIDHEFITLINQSSWVEDNPEIVWHDHGVTNFVPLIKAQLPEAKVVPIVFKKNVSLKQIDSLVAQLIPYLDDQTVVIASLDFAHEVTPMVANKNDTLSRQLIQKRDYSRIIKLSSSYVDSPVALVVYLKLMDATHHQTNFIWQSHAGEFNHNCQQETTSYQVWMSQK